MINDIVDLLEYMRKMADDAGHCESMLNALQITAGSGKGDAPLKLFKEHHMQDLTQVKDLLAAAERKLRVIKRDSEVRRTSSG